MCFWYGLEILRIVYKKRFWNIERFLSYLTFYPPKKVRVEKIFFKIWRLASRVSKEAEFCVNLKNVQKSWVWQKGKNFTQKQNFYWLGKFSKELFFWEKILGNFLTQEFYTFLKSVGTSASFDTLCVQFWRNFFQLL